MSTILETDQDQMLFPWISKKKAEVIKSQNLKQSDLINLGIGDVCHPLPECIIKALHKGIDKMGKEAIGYGPEQGRLDLRSKISTVIYENRFSEDEIFITEGIANSLSILMSIFKEGSTIGVLSPTYPVYKSLLSTCGMSIVEIPADQELNFSPPNQKLDGMIICSPNNPTGKAFSKNQLEAWVQWAKQNNTLILFDGAYEAFIQDPKFPRSIYEIKEAQECCIEIRSFSKSIGFTGLRLGYFVFPKTLKWKGFSLAQCKNLISAKTNGVSYLIQEGGLAALSVEGLRASKQLTNSYMEMTEKLKDHLISSGETVIGGDHAPYLFWHVGGSSKEKFLHYLESRLLVTVPGVGFGMEGFLRLSGFINEDILNKALKCLSLDINVTK
ncbi:MAG: LL-diaminopimelate aminotransferase [Chlamydiia bacterium]|nr:LL-diaminopimelate aminotransferase [Chlamydiia bacterium]